MDSSLIEPITPDNRQPNDPERGYIVWYGWCHRNRRRKAFRLLEEAEAFTEGIGVGLELAREEED